MRLRPVEEPKARTALWSRRLALFAAVLMIIGLIAFRRAPAELTGPVAVMGSAIILASSAALLALIGFVVIWRTGRRGVGSCLAGLFLAALLLAYPGFLAAKAVQLPEINDVSTDLTAPPAFAISGRALEARAGARYGTIPESSRSEQRRAYPDIQPILLDLDADEAYGLVVKAVLARGWRIVDQAAPGGRGGLGHVDAVDRSNFLGLPGDVTIRLRPLVDQTRIDVRSASRFGRHDFGSNAQRVQRFAQELQAQLDNR